MFLGVVYTACLGIIRTHIGYFQGEEIYHIFSATIFAHSCKYHVLASSKEIDEE